MIRSLVIMSHIRVLTGRDKHFITSCSVPLTPVGSLDPQPELSLSELIIRYSMYLLILQLANPQGNKCIYSICTRRTRDQYSVRCIVVGTLISHHKVKIGMV